MDDQFELDVEYQGKQVTIPVRLYKWGYTYRLEASIEGISVFFEPDENESYRAIIEETVDMSVSPDKELIETIIIQLESLRG